MKAILGRANEDIKTTQTWLENFKGKKMHIVVRQEGVRGIRDKTKKGKLSLGYKGFLCRPNQKDSVYKGTGTRGGWHEGLSGTITRLFGVKLQNWLKG